MDGQIYIPQALTNMSQQYRNPDTSWLQDIIAPMLPVERKTGKYLYYTKSNLRKPTNTLRTGKDKTPETDMNAEWKSYDTLTENALKIGVTKDEIEQALTPLEPLYDATRKVMDDMQMKRELDLSTKLANTAVITQNSTPSVQWNASTGAGSPIIDITNAVSTMLLNGLRMPNTIFMGYQVWQQLGSHPDFIDRVKYSQLGALTTELFGQIISEASGLSGVRVMIGKVVYDSSTDQVPEAGTLSNGFVWGKHLWLAYCTQSPALREVNGLYTLVLRNGRYVDGWPNLDRKTTYVRVNDYYSQFLVGPEAFYLLQNVVA